MKKILLLSVIALGIAFTACNKENELIVENTKSNVQQSFFDDLRSTVYGSKTTRAFGGEAIDTEFVGKLTKVKMKGVTLDREIDSNVKIKELSDNKMHLHLFLPMVEGTTMPGDVTIDAKEITFTESGNTISFDKKKHEEAFSLLLHKPVGPKKPGDKLDAYIQFTDEAKAATSTITKIGDGKYELKLFMFSNKKIMGFIEVFRAEVDFVGNN